ncbi:Hypothetical predicted protein [Octopus vulgaris]|uniref:Uncharacterized protein n=1 Tax=Octopus vulgaris TaxID=6645 RepID=A0AA36FC97_OCTVU|nr:Hypothetical predicted protein [Octopus vulgaris]
MLPFCVPCEQTRQEQFVLRRARNAASTAVIRASQTAQQAELRCARDAASTSNSRALETVKQIATRFGADSQRKMRSHVFSKISSRYWSNKAFRYSPHEDCAPHSYIIGNMSTVCVHCNAIRWPAESTDIRCSNGMGRDANTNQFKVVIRGDRAPPGQRQGYFNKPQTDEVVVLIISLNECASNRDIVLEWISLFKSSIEDSVLAKIPCVWWCRIGGFRMHTG